MSPAPTPPGAPMAGAWGGGVEGGLVLLPKIICYINSGVFNSGEFKDDFYFHFRVPPTPARAPTGGDLGGPEGDLVLYY